MISRSQKRSGSDEIKEDMISRLPAQLLLHILSMLPEADANRTRILSNSWKNLWMFLPNLRFVMPFCWSVEEANKFHDGVDQALSLRAGMDIQRFSLYCSKNCDYTRVYDWVSTVVKCRVEELDLRFPADRFRVRFCWDLFRTCNTLVGLTLRGEFVLDVPKDELLFPCLKKIDLVSIVYRGEQSLVNLVSGCPVLEELFVERQVIGKSDDLQTFKVSTPSLKRLKLSFALSVGQDYKALSFHAYRMPTFPNLVKLMLGIARVWGWLLLPDLFNKMPNLEHITFSEGLVPFSHFPQARHLFDFDMDWHPPAEVPDCLRYKMEEITILNKDAVTEQEFDLIKYLLTNSRNLKTFKINGNKLDPKSRKQLLNFYRGSKMCRIDFI